MKKTLLLSFAVLGLAGMAGCSSDTPPPATTPVVDAAPAPAPAPMGSTVVYSCSKKAGDITAMYTMGSPETVQLSMGDQSMTATRVRSKGRSKTYRGDGVTASVSGRVINVTMGGKHLRCVASA